MGLERGDRDVHPLIERQSASRPSSCVSLSARYRPRISARRARRAASRAGADVLVHQLGCGGRLGVLAVPTSDSGVPSGTLISNSTRNSMTSSFMGFGMIRWAPVLLPDRPAARTGTGPARLPAGRRMVVPASAVPAFSPWVTSGVDRSVASVSVLRRRYRRRNDRAHRPTPSPSPSSTTSSWPSCSSSASAARSGPGEVLFSPADDHYDWIVILSGSVEILGPNGQLITRHGARRFLGEVSLVTRQRPYLSTRVAEAGEVVVVPADVFRSQVLTDVRLSDTVLEAFLARRAALLSTRRRHAADRRVRVHAGVDGAARVRRPQPAAPPLDRRRRPRRRRHAPRRPRASPPPTCRSSSRQRGILRRATPGRPGVPARA